MSSEIKHNSCFDSVKWAVVLLLLAAGVWANYYYSSYAISLRLIAWVLLACVVVAIASFTARGRRFASFARDARVEVRKVVWPTRPETMQTTLLVVAMVVVMAILLWGMDTLFLWIIGLLTGQWG